MAEREGRSEYSPVYLEREPLQDHCGVVAAFCPEGTPFFVSGVAGLQKIQTRGYDGAGVCMVSRDGDIDTYKNTGVISQVFTKEVVQRFKEQEGKTWLFQTRYGTSGASAFDNVQPIIRNHLSGESFAFVHNGQFANETVVFGADSDSVRFADTLAQSCGETWDERILSLHNQSSGAWSACIATENELFLLRDRFGIRPLSFGMKMDRNDKSVWVVASETAALNVMGVTSIREVLPGSVIKLDEKGMHIIQTPDTVDQDKAACIFENIYLANGNSAVHATRETDLEIQESLSVTQFRRQCGRLLAQEELLDMPHLVDYAIGVPGTGIAGGREYAEYVGVPYIQAISDVRPPETDARTFMTPDINQIPQKIRDHFYFEKNYLAGMRVVLVDDSMVRGNITKGIIRMLKEECGVQSVHIRILCPPIDKPCYLGINTRSPKELIAYRNDNDIEKIREEIGADSLSFLSDTAVIRATDSHGGFCLGCMAHHNPPTGPHS